MASGLDGPGTVAFGACACGSVGDLAARPGVMAETGAPELCNASIEHAVSP